MISLTMSSLVCSMLVSTLSPPQEDSHKALAMGHSKNRCTQDSQPFLHRVQLGSMYSNLHDKFSLVGRELTNPPNEHLILSGSLAFQSFFQGTSA